MDVATETELAYLNIYLPLENGTGVGSDEAGYYFLFHSWTLKIMCICNFDKNKNDNYLSWQ